MRKQLNWMAAGLMALCACAFSAQWTMTITGSTRAIPSQSVKAADATAWTNGISVAAGEFYANTAGRLYMAVLSGTSTNEPTARMGTATGEDGIEWLACTSTLGRSGVVACVLTGPEIHYNRNADSTTNMPWTVKNIFDPARGDWRFVPADGGTSTVSFLEL
jgi:hypothetical protein